MHIFMALEDFRLSIGMNIFNNQSYGHTSLLRRGGSNYIGPARAWAAS